MKASRTKFVAVFIAVAVIALVLSMLSGGDGFHRADAQTTDFARVDAIALRACVSSGSLADCDGLVISVRGELKQAGDTFVVHNNGMAIQLLDESYVIDPRCLGLPVQVVGRYSADAGGIDLVRSTLVTDNEVRDFFRCSA